MVSVVSFSQVTDNVSNASSNTLQANKAKTAFKEGAVEKDKIEEFEIAALGTTSFRTSNVMDGSVNSYSHSLLVQVALVPVSKNSVNGINLVFYSPNDNISQAASYKDGYLNIYYPVALYQGLREKLEQAMAAKKKITVKTIQKKDGYREGTLAF
jgi:hypothetical protein